MLIVLLPCEVPFTSLVIQYHTYNMAGPQESSELDTLHDSEVAVHLVWLVIIAAPPLSLHTYGAMDPSEHLTFERGQEVFVRFRQCSSLRGVVPAWFVATIFF